MADCVWVVGTSSRKVEGKRRLSPRAVGEELVARAAQGPVAVVFGDERSGLTNAEVERCHDLSAVPTDPSQPSINLAQAVLLYAYEVRMASLAAAPPPPAPLPVAASDAELARVEQTLEETLKSGGFLVDEQPGRTGLRDLVRAAEALAAHAQRGTALARGAPHLAQAADLGLSGWGNLRAPTST